MITIIFIVSQLFKNSGIYNTSPLKIRLKLGILGGISAIILIHFSIEVSPNVIMDLRDFSIILTAFFGGMLPVVITGVITTIYRLLYKGISETSFLVPIGIMAISIGCGALSLTKLNYIWKSVLMFFYSLIIRSIIYFFVIEDKEAALKVVLVTWIASIMIGIGVYYLVLYLVASHKVLKNLKKESTYDYLTGLNNTRSFSRKFSEIKQETNLNHRKLTLMIIDIDHFKHVNDTYGHETGDLVLKQLGRLLRSYRKEYSLISRIGGEEFAIILQNTSREEAYDKAETLRKTVMTHKFYNKDGKKIKITISIGLAVYPETLSEISKLKETADLKLYEAKRTGRNKVCI
ncbi:GGDEF domain-containing protein [Mobilitalea sibirica]|uniref:GGDEF domain-containing protein n=1 Tax=Mobilitalea sibirica TaxID=1462919 RepID=UPI0018D3D22B|nr:diguanylate cyclase [Mobilitalea sibirica]